MAANKRMLHTDGCPVALQFAHTRRCSHEQSQTTAMAIYLDSSGGSCQDIVVAHKQLERVFDSIGVASLRSKFKISYVCVYESETSNALKDLKCTHTHTGTHVESDDVQLPIVAVRTYARSHSGVAYDIVGHGSGYMQSVELYLKKCSETYVHDLPPKQVQTHQPCLGERSEEFESHTCTFTVSSRDVSSTHAYTYVNDSLDEEFHTAYNSLMESKGTGTPVKENISQHVCSYTNVDNTQAHTHTHTYTHTQTQFTDTNRQNKQLQQFIFTVVAAGATFAAWQLVSRLRKNP